MVSEEVTMELCQCLGNCDSVRNVPVSKKLCHFEELCSGKRNSDNVKELC